MGMADDTAKDILPINRPIMDEREVEAAARVIRSGMLTSPSLEGGVEVRRLERKICEMTGSRHAVAVSSGTAALQAALLALGVGYQDEVIVPSFSYVATANAVVSVGAVPVFADILEDCTMDAESVRRLVGTRTAAVVPVHLYGRIARIDHIQEAAGDIPVLEDAAQSLGSTIHGKHSGTLAEVGCYSMYPGKVSTSGEGGIIVSDNDNVWERLRRIRNHGNAGGVFDSFGLNLRMPEVSAAIGAVQVERLPVFLRQRRANAARLSTLLSDADVALPHLQKGEDSNWNLYTIRATHRDDLQQNLIRHSIDAAIYYKTPIHTMSHFRRAGINLPETERAADTVLSLPVHPAVTEQDLDRMARIVNTLNSDARD